MSRVVVDLLRVGELVERMEIFQAHLGRAGDEVDARGRRLAWTGTAAARHEFAQARWAAGAAEVQSALAVLRSIATTAQANYRAAALTNQRMWAP
jgi:uncharacterized protein YukE